MSNSKLSAQKGKNTGANRVRQPQSKPQSAATPRPPETFYVQNPKPGLHHISDIDLTFDAFEVKNLLWEKSDLVSQSYDLAKAINCGDLVRVTQEQYELLLEQERQIEQAELAKSMRKDQQRMVKVETDRGTVDAEYINVNAESPGNRAAINTAGQANDPKTYSMAFQVYCRMCERDGQVPNARAFAAQVENNPRYLHNLLDQVGYVNESSGVASGDTRRGRATVGLAPDYVGGPGGAASFPMTNLNRDQYIAGGQELNIRSSKFDYEIPPADDNIDLIPDAEEIDLMLE